MAVCVSLCLGLAAPRAYAVNEDPVAIRVEKLAAEAKSAYRAADYQKAVELFERAYQLRQVGALLYNIARTYEKLGDTDKAIERYRRYIESTEAEPAQKAKAEARVAAYDEAHKPKPREPEQPPRPRDPGEPLFQAPEDPAVVARREQERALAEWKARRHRDRTVGLTLGGIGVGAALAGVGLWVAAGKLHSTYDHTIGLEASKLALRDRAHTEAVIGDSLWGVAAVTAAIGAYFIYRGYKPERPPAVQASVLAGPRMAGLSLGGTF